ncbi:MAG: hypothetical protein K8T10_16070 [Candidatus Eremiobacteraeota bacterium]|nr:hypothetical protein [Candidatus Eremiobacteraeota bacterium]
MRKPIVLLISVILCSILICGLVAKAQSEVPEITSKVVKIKYPKHGGKVDQEISVLGNARLKPGEVLVILVKNARFGWWYQQSTDKSGDFAVDPVGIGQEQDAHKGEKFYIAAVVVDKNKAHKMKQWREKYASLPGGKTHRIVVFRK